MYANLGGACMYYMYELYEKEKLFKDALFLWEANSESFAIESSRSKVKAKLSH